MLVRDYLYLHGPETFKHKGGARWNRNNENLISHVCSRNESIKMHKVVVAHLGEFGWIFLLLAAALTGFVAKTGYSFC